MKPHAAAAALAALLTLAPSTAWGWGFDAHRIVSQSAVAALPEPLHAFYLAHARRVSDASIEPDSLLRKRDGEAEERRHYLDLDELSRPPFDDIPAARAAARSCYGAARLQEAGDLPWRVEDLCADLTAAFARRDGKEAARLSGWLAHYVADAYQPLHTTRNHDGQLSGNRGVHAAFESDMIGRAKPAYRERARLPAGFAPRAIDDPARFLLDEMKRAYDRVDDVLQADAQAMLLVKKQDKDYFESLEARAGELAGSQMREAAATVASLWHTAWVRAGRPDLPAPRGAKGVRAEKP
ncbi:MAG: zinc dependent phospholipase C family protein [Candidatus Polarisedimenticolia bacterium]